MVGNNSRESRMSVVLTGVEVFGEKVVVDVADRVEQTIQLRQDLFPAVTPSGHSRLVDTAVAKAAGRDLVQHASESGTLLLDRLRVVHVLIAKILNRGREVAEEEHVALADFLGNLDVGTIYIVCLQSQTSVADVQYSPTVPRSRPPLMQNFMFEVPEASVPAVEMCWLMSDAGMRISASETE